MIVVASNSQHLIFIHTFNTKYIFLTHLTIICTPYLFLEIRGRVKTFLESKYRRLSRGHWRKRHSFCGWSAPRLQKGYLSQGNCLATVTLLSVLSNVLNIVLLKKCGFLFRTFQIFTEAGGNAQRLSRRSYKKTTFSTTDESSSMLGNEVACSKNQVAIR